MYTYLIYVYHSHIVFDKLYGQWSLGRCGPLTAFSRSGNEFSAWILRTRLAGAVGARPGKRVSETGHWVLEDRRSREMKRVVVRLSYVFWCFILNAEIKNYTLHKTFNKRNTPRSAQTTHVTWCWCSTIGHVRSESIK